MIGSPEAHREMLRAYTCLDTNGVELKAGDTVTLASRPTETLEVYLNENDVLCLRGHGTSNGNLKGYCEGSWGGKPTRVQA